MNDFDLTGRRALITGGGDGLGKQMTLALADAGAAIVICGRRSEPLESTAEQIRQAGGEVETHVADVTSEADRIALASAVGDVDIIVNNAGAASRAPWGEVELDDWRYIMNLNVEAPFHLIQLLAPAMIERGWGRVINIASIYGLVAGDPSRYPGIGLDIVSYFASKHALVGLSSFLAVEFGRSGVTVNTICPGMFPSPTNDAMLTPEVRAALQSGAPTGRLGSDTDLRTAVLFLASPSSGFVTGHNLVVDGGWTIW
ncbi:MAG: SDR family NAD(P)-dependent oxidoreductase [Ilumatobacteraceae bacterium]